MRSVLLRVCLWTCASALLLSTYGCPSQARDGGGFETFRGLRQNYTLPLGSQLRLPIQAFEPDGSPLPVTMATFPMPKNCRFRQATNELIFTPDASQVRPFDFNIQTSGSGGIVSQNIRIDVQRRSGPTEIRGVVMDADSAEPIGGVEVRVAGSQRTTRTDGDGAFLLTDVPDDAAVVEIDGRTAGDWAFFAENAALLLQHRLFAEQDNVIPRPIYLPKRGAALGRVEAGQSTTVQNADAGVTLAMAADSARLGPNPFVGDIFMPEVPADRTPAELPQGSRPSLVVAIQPAGLTLDPPAQLSWPNRNNLEVGTEVDVWSVHPASGAFVDVGDAVVEANGSIRTIRGGVAHTSLHFLLPRPGEGTGSTPDSIGDNDDQSNQCAVTRGAKVLLRSGNLIAEHALPSYRSMGEERRLRLVYNLKSADPRPVLNADLSVPANVAVPDALRTQLIIGGVEQAQEVFTKATRDRTRLSWQLDARGWPTGWYPHELRLDSVYGTATRTARVIGGTMVTNERGSPIGAGWSIADLPRVYPVANQVLVALTEGDGSIKTFVPQTAAGNRRTDLCFILDGSSSMIEPVGTSTRWERQIAGIQAAVRDGSVIPHNGSHRIAVVQSGGSRAQTDVPFTVVDSAAAAETLANAIGQIPLRGGESPMGTAIDEAVAAFGTIPSEGKQVLCITAAGDAGDQRVAEAAADRALGLGIDAIAVLGVGPGANVERLEGVVRNSALVVVPTFEEFTDSAGEKVRRILRGAPAGEFSTLLRDTDGSYSRVFPNQTVQRFNAGGQLESVTDRRGHTTRYTYDSTGRLTTIQDPAGLTTTLTYSAEGLLQSILRPGDRETTFGHDGRNLVRITDPAGTERRFEYTAEHRLVGLRNRNGRRMTYSFHPATGRLDTELQVETGIERKFTPSQTRALPTDPASTTSAQAPGDPVPTASVVAEYIDGNGAVTKIRTDRLGRALVYTDPIDRTTVTVRDGNGLPRQITHPNGRVDTYRYDEQGNLLARTEAANQSSWQRTWTYSYDPKFNLVSKVTDPEGHVWIHSYDQQSGNLQQTLNPMRKERFYTYNARGLLETVSDENGHVTRYEYNAVGQVQVVRDATDVRTEITRDGAGNALTITEAAGTGQARTRTFTYDAENRVTSLTDGGGGRTAFAYDARGNLLRTTLPTGEQVVREYDSLDRLTRLTQPVDGTTTYTYDSERNVRTRQDALGQTTTFEYDGAGQLRKVIDPQGAEERYSYDGLGNVSAFRNKASRVTTFSYDPHGRRGVIRSSSNRTQRFLYDRVDNLLTHTQGDGSSITYRYDELGRLLEKRVPAVISSGVSVAANTIRYTYDDVGNLLTVTDDDTSVARTYDALDRVREEKTLAGGAQPVVTLTSEFDLVGNRTGLVDSLGGRTGFEFNPAGDLRAVVLASAARIEMDYDGAGRPTATRFPNGMTSTFAYASGSGRLQRITHGIGGQAARVDMTIAQNGVGNITGITEPGRERTFGYDALLRLTTVVEPNAGESYAYGPLGNRTRSHRSGMHRHSADNELLEDDQFNYVFDQRGNLESRTPKQGGARSVFVWDAQNLLIEARTPGGAVIRYRHDGLGRKVERDPGGGAANVTRYVYDDAQMVMEWTDSVLTRHTFGARVDQVLASASPAGDIFYHADHLGSVRSITDSTGAEIGSYSYDAFGTPTFATGAGANAAQAFFTGRQWDADTQLYDYRTRWYDPRIGRFLSADPLTYGADEAGTNAYTYVDNRPLVFTDPTGECAWCVAGTIGGLTDIGVQLWPRGGRPSCTDGRDGGITTATGAAGTDLLQRSTKVGRLGTAPRDLGKDRVTYRWVKLRGVVQGGSHPIRGWWPDWASYPHRHVDALGYGMSRWLLPQVEPMAPVPADAAAPKRADCACR